MAVSQGLLLLLLVAVCLTPTAWSGDLCQTGFCNLAPCRANDGCTSFLMQYLATDLSTSPSQTSIQLSINWDTTCGNVEWVAIGLDSGTSVQSMSSPVHMAFYQWDVVITDSTLNFTFAPGQTYSTGVSSEFFTFTLLGYSGPGYSWQLDAGYTSGLRDTASNVSFGLCACSGCDASYGTLTIETCTIEYPLSGATGRPGDNFNEEDILWNYEVSLTGIQVYYNDEHAMTLGLGNYSINGTNILAPFSEYPGTPSCVAYPQVGLKDFNSGLWANVDPYQRPLPPALFITDITNDPSSTAGDWQYYGQAITAHLVCGTWKGGSMTYTPSTGPSTALACDPSPNIPGAGGPGPMCNKREEPRSGGPPPPPPPPPPSSSSSIWYLGPAGNFTVPAMASNNKGEQAYGTQVTWFFSELGLQPSHSYRFQFIVHDGDQNGDGGDCGEGCVYIKSNAKCPAGYTGTNCSQCDTDPEPGDNWYSWFCNETSPGSDQYNLIKLPTYLISAPPYNETGFLPTTGSLDGYIVTCNCTKTQTKISPSATPSSSPSCTPSVTPSASPTPSVTPTISVTPSVTPTISVTPSRAPHSGLSSGQTAGIAIGVVGGVAAVGAFGGGLAAAGFFLMRYLNKAPAPEILPTGETTFSEAPAFDNTLHVGNTIDYENSLYNNL